ncbi:SH3 domain-containing protein [Chitinophaga dinghuensis]|uniref:SH3 domain-containing protein n=1 Tax=Chitinophaga dinghuensis TaxID=1539050 RepID=A0A327W4R4_9BACT|nr:DUF4236 domain-containing protein [Chitinophaga dinghuensis]RAJ83155.1 SH3 domain-containing protein [Chitinophaga dinghuensis]
MGWSYRKSISAGPFRMNFSKKGISYSVGVKGARINMGPRGTFVNLSANGISYRKRISPPVSHPPSPSPSPSYETLPEGIPNNITSSPIEALTDTDSHNFITELNQKSAQVPYAGRVKLLLFIILGILLFVSYGKQEILVRPALDTAFAKIIVIKGANIRKEPNVKSDILQTVGYDETFALLDTSNIQWLKVKLSDSSGYIKRDLAMVVHQSYEAVMEEEWHQVNDYLWYELIFSVLCFIPLTSWLKRLDKQRFAMELQYDMDDRYQQVYQQFKAHFITFSQTSRIWQYLNVQGTTDFKRNGGAGSLIKRTRISSFSDNKMPIPYFITNVDIPWISLSNMELYFLPERLLIKRGKDFAAVFYKNLQIRCHVSNFIESESLPPDAKVVDYTWQFVNKAGGPDKRFNNNRRLPVCAYSQYTFTSDTGIFEVISTSKQFAMDDLATFLMKIGAFQTKMGECYQ